MTDTTAASVSDAPDQDMWIEAGRGWGARAEEWAYLFEPYALPANQLVLDRVAVGPATRYLDVACGSGFAANLAHRRGATVSGLDASEDLIDIARARTPDGDFRVGDMFALPFAEGTFDVVTSFNGIWSRCDDALDQVRTVLTDDGRLGLTFWGAHERMGLMPYFLTVIQHSPPSHQAANIEIGETSKVMADMLVAAEFELLQHGTVEVVNEWPDVDTAVRALAAAGPSVPAIAAVGYDDFCEALREVVAPLHDRTGRVGVRISSELGWVTARPA
ncbi:MAG: class I SAM-dependent methyltransferase [Ilumatobacteraceae bacterium]|nr:class I SAM-dependent methyltransferase [Ilumatobacteraceae bacterium]